MLPENLKLVCMFENRRKKSIRKNVIIMRDVSVFKFYEGTLTLRSMSNGFFGERMLRSLMFLCRLFVDILTNDTLAQWYSTFFVRVPPDIISLQLCTPTVVGV
jgi:hypothetical protein